MQNQPLKASLPRVSATHDEEGAMPTGLQRRAGGRYSVRRRIPEDLVEAFGGKKEFTKALGTSDPKQARLLLPIFWSACDQIFQQKRDALAGSVAPQVEVPLAEISPTIVSLIELDTLRADRDAAAANGTLAGFISLRRDALRLLQGMLDGEVPPVGDLRTIEGKRNALRALLTGESALAISAARKARADIAEAKIVEQAKTSHALDRIVDRWAAERPVSKRGVTAHRAVARWFDQRTGNLPVESITKRDVVSFKDQLVEEGKSAANIKVKLSRLRTLLNYAVDNDIIAKNPTDGVKIVDKQRAKDKRREFNKDELAALFNGPVHQEGLRPVGGGGAASYWLPLLALYTGARQTELGQLHPDDVCEEAYDVSDTEMRSAWVVRFVDNPDRGQKVKTEGSERRVPIHSDLIQLGFLDIASAARSDGRDRIFHKIKPTSEGELMGSWSKWFGRYRRSLGVSGKDTPFHSFRHSFKHYARACNLDKAVNDAITGHETGDVADQYGALDYPLGPLVEAMARYRVLGFTLPPPPDLR
ncbi:DUF6538 domain-containing protein [Brevundimonas bullata]|uniref:DUF6538 domain-containing protein n=1 Tax=Brevundimonas bullata TaxID=13160 RepID=UPI002FD9DBA2